MTLSKAARLHQNYLNREWRKKHPNYQIEYNHKHHEKHIQSAITSDARIGLWFLRYYARRKVKLGVQCDGCGTMKGRFYRHHPDYSQPLLVMTLCKKCHDEKDNEIRENSVGKVKT